MAENKRNWLSTDKITQWLFQNFKLVLSVIAIAVIGLVSSVSFMEWSKKKEKQIFGEFYIIQKSLLQAGQAANGKDYGNEDSNPYNFLKKKKDKTLVYSEQMDSIAQTYTQKVKDYKRYKAAAVAAIDLADFFYKHKKKEEAKQVLSVFASKKKCSTVYNLLHMQLAYYHMNDKNCDQALVLWKKIASNKRAETFHKEAHKQMAFCYEEQNNYEEAKNNYEMIIKNYPNDLDLKSIKNHLQIMTLKQKLKTQ